MPKKFSLSVTVNVETREEESGDESWEIVRQPGQTTEVEVSDDNFSRVSDVEEPLVLKNVRLNYGRMFRELHQAKREFREQPSLGSMGKWVALRMEFRELRELVRLFPRQNAVRKQRNARA